MMSRDGARTAQPARPEEPPHRLSGEGQRGQDTGRQGRRGAKTDRPELVSGSAATSFTRPKSRCCSRSGDVIPQNAVDDRLRVRDWNHVPYAGHHDVHSVERGSKLSGDGARCQQRLCANQDGCRWRRLGQPCERRRVRPRRNHLQPQRMVEAYWLPSIGPAAERPLTMHTPRQLASSRVPHDSSCGSGGRSAR